jgi:hypothetical protein
MKTYSIFIETVKRRKEEPEAGYAAKHFAGT